jgi:hypothetical protein
MKVRFIHYRESLYPSQSPRLWPRYQLVDVAAGRTDQFRAGTHSQARLRRECASRAEALASHLETRQTLFKKSLFDNDDFVLQASFLHTDVLNSQYRNYPPSNGAVPPRSPDEKKVSGREGARRWRSLSMEEVGVHAAP